MLSDRIGSRLEDQPFDPELAPGARNAIETCLALKHGERLTLVTDRATLDIAASLAAAARRIDAAVESFVLEDEAVRPLAHCPDRILAAAARGDAVLACIQPQEGEIGSRSELIQVVELHQIRYAHMVWITPAIMRQSMRADYRAVDRLSDWVLAQVRGAERIVVQSPAGTDIEATFRPDHTWIKTSGLINPKYWSNLPGGEAWSVPDDLNGVFVVDGAVGDYLGPKYGDLSATPLTLEIEGSRLRSVRCDDRNLERDFVEYCSREINGNRIGEFAFGTNIAISHMIGNMLQDEKVPGVHIAFGNPCPNLTGVPWTCVSHIDGISRHTDVWADGRQIMANGHFQVGSA